MDIHRESVCTLYTNTNDTKFMITTHDGDGEQYE